MSDLEIQDGLRRIVTAIEKLTDYVDTLNTNVVEIWNLIKNKQ